jgi:hypothetical protein
VKSGIWNILQRIYLNLIPVIFISSDLSNHYGSVPYKFAVVQISELEILIDILICRARWDNFIILQKRDLLLNNNIQIRQKYIMDWRRNIVRKTIIAFQIIKRKKKRIFGNHFYFRLMKLYFDGSFSV